MSAIRVMGCAAILSLTVACGNGAEVPSEMTARENDGGAGVANTSVLDLSAGTWIDLTHSFSAETIYWPTANGFQLDTVSWGVAEGGYFYSAFQFSTAEHGGTHLDAPVHFAEGRRSTDQIPLNQLIAPAVVLDVSNRATPDYLISSADLGAWEAENGPIPDGSILLLRTGWADRWGDRTAYLGTELTGEEAVPELHFPGLAPEAASWLVENRRIAALGIDTPSIDYGQSTDFATHVILYGANIVGFENVGRMNALPATGAYVFALPMKIEGGSGGPLRIVAFVPS